MSDFTFLTDVQSDELDVLKKRGRKAAITDFSILLGGQVINHHIYNDSSLEGRTGGYWTKSYKGNEVRTILPFGGSSDEDVSLRCLGARPVTSFLTIESILTNEVNGR